MQNAASIGRRPRDVDGPLRTFAILSSAAVQLHQSGHSWIEQYFVGLIVSNADKADS